MYRRLLVPNQHMTQPGLGVERVIQGQHRTARITEDGIDAQVEQSTNQHHGASWTKGGRGGALA